MQTPVAICKNLNFATRMFELYPANQQRYYSLAEACVQQLESQAAYSEDVFVAWKIGCIALDIMKERQPKLHGSSNN